MTAMLGVAPVRLTPSETSLPPYTLTLRTAVMPSSPVRLTWVRRNSNSSLFRFGFRRSISRNFLGSLWVMKMRVTVYPLAPMLLMFSAITRFIPEITDITAMSVVVARMIPSSVKKLHSLLECSDWTAPVTASQNDACEVFILRPGRNEGQALSVLAHDPFHYRLIGPKAVRFAANKSQVAAMPGNQQFDPRIGSHRFGPVNPKRNKGVVLRLDEQGRHADGIQVVQRGLRPVIIRRI